MRVVLMYSGLDAQAEATVALQGWQWRKAMRELDQWMKDQIKHGKMSAPAKKKLAEVRDELYEILKEDNLSLDD